MSVSFSDRAPQALGFGSSRPGEEGQGTLILFLIAWSLIGRNCRSICAFDRLLDPSKFVGVPASDSGVRCSFFWSLFRWWWRSRSDVVEVFLLELVPCSACSWIIGSWSSWLITVTIALHIIVRWGSILISRRPISNSTS